MIKQVDQDLWVAEQPLKTLGIAYGARMTVVRLSNDELVVISPVGATSDLLLAVKELGSVKFLIAPSSFHPMFMPDWVKAFPDAKLLVVPQLIKKRPDLKAAFVIDESFRPIWGTDLNLLYVPGGRMYSEAVFLHVPSKTLILTDLCFNLQKADGIFARVMLTLYGVYKKFGPSKAVALFMGDRDRLRQNIDEIAKWDFKRVIMAHGDILENAEPAAVRRSFDQALKTKSL